MKGGENMKPYYLWDYYEDYGLIGNYDTEEEARLAAEDWLEDTDGECDVVLFAYCETTQGYENIDEYTGIDED